VPWRRHEAQHRERAHRLAAAGFAHPRHRLAGIDRIGDAVDRLDEAVRARELDFQALDLEQSGHRRSP
jgi:hypothetical protein